MLQFVFKMINNAECKSGMLNNSSVMIYPFEYLFTKPSDRYFFSVTLKFVFKYEGKRKYKNVLKA